MPCVWEGKQQIYAAVFKAVSHIIYKFKKNISKLCELVLKVCCWTWIAKILDQNRVAIPMHFNLNFSIYRKDKLGFKTSLMLVYWGVTTDTNMKKGKLYQN